MNARCDSFDMINYSVGECRITDCTKSNYERCRYCWLILETGLFIDDDVYYYNTYYSEGENVYGKE